MAKISSKKLIERIEHLKEIEFSSYRGYDEKYEKALNDAIDIIHTLNAETAENKSNKVKHGKWTFVNDRTPNRGEVVLTVRIRRHTGKPYIAMDVLSADNQWVYGMQDITTY